MAFAYFADYDPGELEGSKNLYWCAGISSLLISIGWIVFSIGFAFAINEKCKATHTEEISPADSAPRVYAAIISASGILLFVGNIIQSIKWFHIRSILEDATEDDVESFYHWIGYSDIIIALGFLLFGIGAIYGFWYILKPEHQRPQPNDPQQLHNPSAQPVDQVQRLPSQRYAAPQFIPEKPLTPPPRATDEFSPSAAHRAQQAPGTGWQCPKCGNAIEGTYRFCDDCGTMRGE